MIPRYLVDTPNHYSPSCPSLPLQSLHTLGTFRFHPQFLLETLSPSAPRLQDLHVCGHHSHSLQETLFSLSTGAQGDDCPTNACLLASGLDSLLCIMPLFRERNDWLPYATGLACFVPSLVFKTHLYAGELQVIGGLSYCELPMLWAASRRKCLCLGSGEGFPKERPFELDLEG